MAGCKYTHKARHGITPVRCVTGTKKTMLTPMLLDNCSARNLSGTNSEGDVSSLHSCHSKVHAAPIARECPAEAREWVLLATKYILLDLSNFCARHSTVLVHHSCAKEAVSDSERGLGARGYHR